MCILSDDEALALFVDCKFTKNQYNRIRRTLNQKGINVLPTYKRIAEVKTRCYPKIEVSETSTTIKLQDLLDHTAKRILKIENVKNNVLKKQRTVFELISKYGCDGSSGLTQYKQSFTDCDNLNCNSIFMSCLVPISLRANTDEIATVDEYWKNENPSSTKYCRTIKFAYQKGTLDIIKYEIE